MNVGQIIKMIWGKITVTVFHNSDW